jgi:PAS domain S-box-containing protein
VTGLRPPQDAGVVAADAVAAARAIPATLRTQRRVFRGLTVALTLLLLAVVAWFQWQTRANQLDVAAGFAERQADLLAEDLHQVLAMAEVAIEQTEARLRDADEGRSLGEVLARGDAERARLLAALPLPFDLHALDASGRSIDAAAVPGADPLPDPRQDHVHALPPAGDRTWMVNPVQGPANRRYLPITRWAEDEHRGIAAFSVDVDHAALLARLGGGRAPVGGSTGLYRLDAAGLPMVLAQVPFVEAELGRTLQDGLAQALEQALAQAPRGVFQAAGRVDGVPRLQAYRRLSVGAEQLVVVYGIDTTQLLATWRQRLPLAVLGSLLLAACLLWGGRRLDRSLQSVVHGQRALVRSESHFRILADSLPDVVVRIDAEGRHRYANAAFERASGLAPAAVLGKTWAEFGIPPAHESAWRAALARVLGQGSTERVEFVMKGPTGVRHWEALLAPEPGGDGEPPGALVISRDVTERREAEDAAHRLAAELELRVQERTAELSRSEARLRMIFETVPLAISEEDWSGVQRLLRGLRAEGVVDGPAYFAAHPGFLLDCLRAVQIRRMNRKAISLHEVETDPASLPGLQAFYPTPESLSQFAGEVEALWTGQRLYTTKKSLPSLGGRPLNLMMTMSLPGLDDTDATALVCMVDISELDRLNAELAHSLSRLRQANQELETFTDSVSHDLKAPLRGIDGYSRLLLSDHAERLDEEGRRFLSNIRQASQHMGVLIDDLLAYSRLERRQPTLGRQQLAPLVEAVLAACRHEAQQPGVAWEVDVAPELFARADVQGLTMALRNLVDNALKFSRDARPPRIRIAAWRGSGVLHLSVQDNGLGFDMKFHDRIFSIFQRLHRAEDYPGTGVGLAIVRKAMERMGGQVRAESSPGHGATFFLELPEAA